MDDLKTIKVEVSASQYSDFEKVNTLLGCPDKGMGISPGIDRIITMILKADTPETIFRNYLSGVSKQAMEAKKKSFKPAKTKAVANGTGSVN